MANRLILANPGTGKTTTLARRVIELLKEGAQPKDILCITFTEKAANEMRQRIRELAKKEGLDAKLHDLSIHTFHSYALAFLEESEGSHQVLGNNAIRYSIFKSFEANKALNYSLAYIIGDIVPKVENAIRYLKSYGITPEAIDLARCRPYIEQAYIENGITNISQDEQLKFADYFVDAFQDYEKSKKPGYIDYNDMLLRFMRLRDRKRFRFVLVDELQDVNEIEADIALESGEELFLVGDRKQSIFGFQGGSIRNFAKMEKLPNMEREVLGKNYRSSRQIIKYAAEAFKSRTGHLDHAQDLASFSADRDAQGHVEIIGVNRDQQPSLAVKKAISLSGKGRTAIITRSNGQILGISRMLDSKNVKYSTTISNATSQEAKNTIIAFLKGILYDDHGLIVNALFTPFAGVSLKEAFEVSKLHGDRKLDDATLHRLVPRFMVLRTLAFSRAGLASIFNEVIIPISVSIGKDYYITASAIRDNISEFFDVVEAPQISDLFNYLQVTEESYEPIGRDEDLVLTTVHKSKGLEFDNVIYVPRKAKDSFSFVDAVVYGLIKGMKGIDIREELGEEQLRVDFVAFTRARDRLTIIADSKSAQEYAAGEYGVESYETMEDEPEPISRKFDQAYSMFVNGRYDEARKLIGSRDPWLRERIYDYFKHADRLSYTLIEGLCDPFEFLKRNILCMREESSALNMGNKAHSMAEGMFNKTLDESTIPSDEKPYLENIRRLDLEIRSSSEARQIGAEDSIVLPLCDLVPGAPEGMEFKAKLDAVYKTREGYLIVDWKTDRTDGKASEHRRQLAAYRKLYSIANKVDEGSIRTAIGFIALRGNINTGKMGCRLEVKQPDKGQYDTVLRHIGKFLEYRKDPQQFIKELKKKGDESILCVLVKQEVGWDG